MILQQLLIVFAGAQMASRNDPVILPGKRHSHLNGPSKAWVHYIEALLPVVMLFHLIVLVVNRQYYSPLTGNPTGASSPPQTGDHRLVFPSDW